MRRPAPYEHEQYDDASPLPRTMRNGRRFTKLYAGEIER
jgi:hypothetical protein